MGEKSDLNWADSVEKIRHIAEGEIAMMHTFNGRKVGVARPMATAGVDADGTLWFLSPEPSPKNEQLDSEQVMQLTYSVKSRSEYLVLDGRGSVLRDQVKLAGCGARSTRLGFPKARKIPRSL